MVTNIDMKNKKQMEFVTFSTVFETCMDTNLGKDREIGYFSIFVAQN